MTEIARDKVRQHVGVATAAAAAGTAFPKQTKEPAVCPTDEEAMTPKNKTRSWDYVWRSGVAGGVAGCAVSTVFLFFPLLLQPRGLFKCPHGKQSSAYQMITSFL